MNWEIRVAFARVNTSKLDLHFGYEDSTELKELLNAGWEPFAVVQEDHMQPMVFLRKLLEVKGGNIL